MQINEKKKPLDTARAITGNFLAKTSCRFWALNDKWGVPKGRAVEVVLDVIVAVVWDRGPSSVLIVNHIDDISKMFPELTPSMKGSWTGLKEDVGALKLPSTAKETSKK